ncbi:MAG: HlyD family efflux transporter periplasmic adaptor subunit [Chloroflexi bacterium]|nr:HlyD family efflux transporter periplasmic adaptor subunit [Chloroflexota bacterium]
MKKPITIIGIIVALIAVTVGVGWVYYRANPDAWDAFVAEMNGEGGGTAVSSSQPRPVSRPSRQAGTLIASGSIETEEITVAAELGGRVVEIMADEGDAVTANMTLLQLDQRILLAQRDGAAANVAQAQAALDAAQAQLDLALAGATTEDILAAESGVLAAEGMLAVADAAHVQAEINANSARTVDASESSVALADAMVAQAEGVLAAANADLARANAELSRVLAGARPEEVAMFQELVNQAYAQYLIYENIHFVEFIDPGIGGWPEERARWQRDSALGALNAAQAQLDMVNAGASSSEVSAAHAMVAAARAQVSIAEAGVTAAEAGLSPAQAAPETTQDLVSLADAGIAAAAAQVSVAEGQLAQAQAQLARLQAGATPEEIAALRAQVAQAEAVLTAAAAALTAVDIQIDQATLTAPVGGIVLERLLQIGELAVPGAPLFTVANLDDVTLTVYVPEAELGKVFLGQDVDVTVDAYDRAFMGVVSHIASQAEFTPKNVQTQEERVHMVFAVKVRLDNPDQLLKPGMPADAVFAEID